MEIERWQDLLQWSQPERFRRRSSEQYYPEFGQKPVGSVSFSDIKNFADNDPECCIRTYDVRKVRALHKVAVKSAETEEE